MLLPILCPAGQYCEGTLNVPKNCPKGTFSDMQGLKAASECQNGAFGFFYTFDGAVSPNAGTQCTATNYCYPEAGAPITDDNGNMKSCASGEICATGTAVPELCPPGTYTEDTSPSASYNCIKCKKDYYCPEWGLGATSLLPTANPDYRCPAGYECLGGAIH